MFDELNTSLSAKLDAYDVILGKQKYLAGNVRLHFIPFDLIALLISC